jgi:SAM-dependent methyltransferase
MAESVAYSEEGHRNLLLAEKRAGRYYNWIYEEIRPFLSGDIFEVGSGIGTCAQLIVRDNPGSRIILSDGDSRCVTALRERFEKDRNVSCHRIDIANKSDLESLECKPDCAIAINVLEHVKDDVVALNNVYEVLNRGGHFVFLVPAHKFLYNRFDEAVGHYRRYTIEEIKHKVSQTEFNLIKAFYFNFLSIIGWYLNGNVLHKTIMNESALSLYNNLIPAIRFFERYVIRKKLGISLIVVLKKD